MKICPKCQQQFPNGFQYCPNDTEYLIANEEYARRTKPAPPTSIIEPVERPPASPIPPRSAEPFRSKPTAPIRPEPPRTEPIRPAQPAPRPETSPFQQPATGYGGTRSAQIPQTPPRQAQPPSQPTPAPPERPLAQPNQSRTVAQTAAARSVAQPSNFGFSIPESPGLISRLLGGFKSIGDSFKFTSVRPGATGDFQFLLKDESLVLRIVREIVAALNEFIRNPRVFIRELVRGEGTNRFRRNALLAGSELALTGFFTVFVTMHFLPDKNELSMMSWSATLGYILAYLPFILFWPICFIARVFLLLKLVYRTTNSLIVSKVSLDVVNWTPIIVVVLVMFIFNNCKLYNFVFPGRCKAPVEQFELIADLPPIPEDMKIEVKAEKKPVKEKTLGGSKPKPQKAAGGGGGGRQRPEPPSKGAPPQMALAPQIVLPNPEPPKIKNPTLPVPMTVYGDPSLRMPKGPIGDPTGVPAPPSPGPGTGGGIGRSAGTGVGGGTGGGVGPGRGGNVGGGDMNLGGGRSIEPMTASLRPTILYREKAKYTEEARQNKIQGTVVLQVVFNVNGSITEIRVIRSLPDGLTEKAIEAARKIRFNPAVKNGTPVSVRGQLEFTFNLY